MDTSETYIKMCDCEEIQSLRREERHTNTGKWKAGDYWTDLLRKHIFIVPQYIDAWADLPDYLHHPSECIWLPTQSQLQEMVKKHWDDYSIVACLDDFQDWVLNQCDGLEWSHKVKNLSMEQLWLAFVIKELHNKVWDGEKWILRGHR
jgi:hypothetical protein